MKKHFRNASLYILPLQKESDLYGIEALKAAYAGVPSLISQSAGVARYFNILLCEEDSEIRQLGISKVDLGCKAFETDPIIPNFDEFAADVESWWPKVREKICDADGALKYANEIRDKCLLDTKMAATHHEFGRKITGRPKLVCDYSLEIVLHFHFLYNIVQSNSCLTVITYCNVLPLVNATKHEYQNTATIRWGPYNGGNLPKVRSRYCPHEILPWPSKVEIKVVYNVPLGIRFWITLIFPC